MSITRTPRSSSITKKVGRCAPRPPSTTPVISRSASGCTIYPPCGRSAFKPTDVCCTSNVSATIAGSAKTMTELSPGERADVSWITTEAIDRQKEVVLVDGFNDEQFKANPIVTINHDYTKHAV